MVRRPWGSTDRASFSDSELARSTFAAETESMTLKVGKMSVRNVFRRTWFDWTNQFGLEM